MAELYHVIICRRDQPGQFQLNYRSKERADAITALIDRKNGIIGGFRPPLSLEDDFSARLVIGDGDIGYILLQDVSGHLDYSAEVATLQAEAQARAQTRINATVNRNGILIPTHGGPQ